MEYPKYKKVLFCTDFSENSDYAFDFAYGIAKRDEGLLYVLHVRSANPHQAFVENAVGEEILEEVQKNIQEDLDNNYKERYVKKIENGIRYKVVTKSAGKMRRYSSLQRMRRWILLSWARMAEQE